MCDVFQHFRQFHDRLPHTLSGRCHACLVILDFVATKGFEIRTRSGVGRTVHGTLKFDSLACARYANEPCITMRSPELLVLDLLFCNLIHESFHVSEEGKLDSCA
jgi:hypothetical protein